MRFAKPVAYPERDIPRRLQLFLRAIRIIASKRQIAEGAKRTRLAKPVAYPERDIPRLLQLGLRVIEISAPKRQIASGVQCRRFRLLRIVCVSRAQHRGKL